MEAVINKLGGMEGVDKLLRGELTLTEPKRNWREENGIIYLSVTSDGTTGKEWIERLTKKGYRLSDYAQSLLRSPEDFKPTYGVTTEIAILKGILFGNSDRITSSIRAFTAERNLIAPNAEVACLIRDIFSDEDLEAMGLIWIVAMHEPIKDSDDVPRLLSVSRNGGGCWLVADCDKSVYGWSRGDGYAFAVSETPAGA